MVVLLWLSIFYLVQAVTKITACRKTTAVPGAIEWIIPKPCGQVFLRKKESYQKDTQQLSHFKATIC